MLLVLWVTLFVVSLAALIKGSDWLLLGAERVGLSFGLSPFIIGVTIVGIGTGLPEMLSGIVAVIADVRELPVANAVGSNIANILLVTGVLAVWSRKIRIQQNLLTQDLPILAVTTVLFLMTALDSRILLVESLLLMAIYVVYLVFSVSRHSYSEEAHAKAAIPEEAARHPRWWQFWRYHESLTRPDIQIIDWARIVLGIVALALGARYVVFSVEALSAILGIGAGVIALLAIAFGTSLPEVIVSLKAAKQGQPEVALGNIIGSSVFNLLMVVGAGGLFGTLVVDALTFAIGLPVMAAVTALFVISSVSRRVHAWEGALYLLLYVVFVGKTVGVL